MTFAVCERGKCLDEIDRTLVDKIKFQRAALERAGIEDFRWRDLRHTFATWHRQAGTPAHELQMLGGWLTRAMVDRYAHIALEGLQQASSRLDNVLQGYVLATPEQQRERP